MLSRYDRWRISLDSLPHGTYEELLEYMKERWDALGTGKPFAKRFETKDSGKRQEFESGMHRDTTEGKVLYHLAVDGPMFKRYAELMTRGAVKYAARNWMQANSTDELERFRESAFRHFMQWFNGETDEDHAAAVIFNINGAEYVQDKLRGL